MLGVMVDIIIYNTCTGMVCLVIYIICLIYAYYDACGAPHLEHVISMRKRMRQRRQNDDKDEGAFVEEAEQGSAGGETMAWARRRRSMSEP